jgi:REP element-mobilizing transposase RayT
LLAAGGEAGKIHLWDLPCGQERQRRLGHTGSVQALAFAPDGEALVYAVSAFRRGNGRARVFHDADDYHDFVRLLHKACARRPMRLVGFCLMPNHFHLVLWPAGDDDLSPWMQWLLTTHVHGYRKRYRGSGHVWQGRFKAFPVDQDDHLRTVLRYVERRSAPSLGWSRLPRSLD